MYAESKRGRETRNLLMDFGFTPQALNNNGSLLAVDPSELDALVLVMATMTPLAASPDARNEICATCCDMAPSSH